MLQSFDFITSFFLSKDLSILTAFLCMSQYDLNEFSKYASDSGIRANVCHNSATCVEMLSRTTISNGIVLDLTCDGATDFISEASKPDINLFNVIYTWLVLDEDDILNTTKIESQFKESPVLPNSNVVLKTNDKLYDFYRTKIIENIVINEINDNSNATKDDLIILWNDLPTTTNRRKNLGNIYLKAATIISQPQYFTGWDDVSMKHIDTWPKFTFPLMKNLAEDLNYRVNLKQIDNYGVLQSDGTFDGLCGQLQRKELEFGITSMFMRKDRWDAVDFFSETIVLKSSFMFRQPPQSTVSNIFILPFDTDVWIVSVGVFMLVALMITLLSKGMVKTDRSLTAISASEVFSLTIGSVCQQGTHLNPFLSSIRLIIFFSFVTSLFIFTSYSAKIVALLQTPSTAIKTITDLAHSPMTLGVQETTYKKVYFTESTDPGTKFLYKHKIAAQGDGAYMSVVDGIGRMKKGLFAFQVEASSGYAIISQTFTEREKCGLSEIEAFKLPMVAVPIKKFSGYKDLFASRLRWQREAGLFDRARKIWIAQKPICNEGLTGFVSVGITECLPALKVIIYGIFFAVFVCVSEIIIHRYQHCVRCII